MKSTVVHSFLVVLEGYIKYNQELSLAYFKNPAGANWAV